MKEKWLKISHSGELSYVELPPSVGGVDFEFLHALNRELGSELIEIVRVRGFDSMFPVGSEPVIIIDECGKLRDDAHKRCNSLCTLMYAPGADWICGDAILGNRIGPDVYPFPEHVYQRFAEFCLGFCDVRLA